MKISTTNISYTRKPFFCGTNQKKDTGTNSVKQSYPQDSFQHANDTANLSIPKGVLALHSQKKLAEKGEITDPVYDAFHDQLTSLRTKEYLLCRLPQIISKAKAAGNEIQIAMLDMDNFKSINEILGYEIGDEFLQSIAKNIKKVADKNDLGAYRFGGEEFVIVFKNTSRKKNIEIANEILSEIKKDEVLNSYSKTYLNKCQKKLNALTRQNIIYDEVERTKAISSFLEDYIQELAKNPFGSENEATHLYYKLNEINILFIENFSKLITQRLTECEDEQICSELEKGLNDCLDAMELKKKNEDLKRQLASSDATLSIDNIKRIYGNADNYCQYIKENTHDSASAKELISLINRTQKRINQKCDSIKDNSFLNKYLESLNHKLEIAQLEKWIEHFEKENCFTLTCGIKTFENSILDEASPMSMINDAGEILKRGKNTSKGKIYCDKI